jgi:hypothetical protein
MNFIVEIDQNDIFGNGTDGNMKVNQNGPYSYVSPSLSISNYLLGIRLILCSSLFFVPKLHEPIPLAGSIHFPRDPRLCTGQKMAARYIPRYERNSRSLTLYYRAANGSEIDTH